MTTIISTDIRAHLLDTYDHLKRMQAGRALAGSTAVLEHLAGAVYELNRGASVSALRSVDQATADALASDIIENLRQVLVSQFEKNIDLDAVEEMRTAASEIRKLVLQLPVAA